ncbi:MAG TPA: helix-turn-helix domain-containing protein [Anaerolineales bacterium]|nr:helix-turn-helix domain-containing protein [Anaerolineales bacterium]
MAAKSLGFKDLIRLTFSEPVVWLHGESQSQRAVHWITTSLQEAQPGDVLLTNASNLGVELMQQAQEQRVAALLLLGEASLSGYTNLGELMVVAAPEPICDLRELQRLMLAILINNRAALVERGVRIHAQLSQLEAEGKGLEGLAKAMAEISGRGTLIQDKRGRILAQYPASTLLTIWEDVLGQLGVLGSLPEALNDRKQAGCQGAIIAQKIPGGLERLIAPITVGEVARGYLSLVGMEGEFDDLDYLVIEQGEFVCATEMARNKAIREAEKRLKGDLLTALLQDNLSPRDARLWVQTMGLDLEQAHVALRFAWDEPALPSRRRLETLVNGEIARLNLQVIGSPLGTEVICFCQVPPQARRPEPALAFGQAVLDQAGREHPETLAHCGIGMAALSLEDWRHSLRQAGQALEMSRRLGEQKPLYYSDLSVYRLLFQLEHSPELIAFQEESVGPLLAFDGANVLMHTLEAYFEHNGNLSKTAQALHIHRNTLIYRMERIAAITNLELDKPDHRLALQLSLRIYRMLGRKTRS